MIQESWLPSKKRKGQPLPNNTSIIEDGQYTVKSPGDLR